MFKFYGHNCFEFIVEDSILITDPWFSKEGAFFGSWYQYPKNQHLASECINSLKEYKNKFIYISHEHKDHFDIDFLKKVPKDTKIIIPLFKDKFFLNCIDDINLKVEELDDSKKTKLSKNLHVTFYMSDVGFNHDSSVLIETDSFTFLNQNDNKIFDRLNEININIDFYSVQFSGANWHPECFAYSDRRKALISGEKVLSKLNNVLSGIEKLKPKYFIPAAGPPVFPFLDERLSYGKDNIFIHQDKLDAFLKENDIYIGRYLNPGQHFDDALTKPISAPNSKYLKDYKDSLNDVWKKIAYLFDKQELINVINFRLYEIRDLKISNTPMIIFNIQDDKKNEKIFIDLNLKKIVNNFNYDSPYEELIADKKYFYLMHSGERWQDIYLSMQAKVVRRPDIYNNFATIFLFSDVENIRDSFKDTMNIPNERIIITSDKGEEYEINRFCPHQGADLCGSAIKDNILICPRHGWEFDLKDGGINKKSGETICAKIEPDE